MADLETFAAAERCHLLGDGASSRGGLSEH